MSKYSIRPELTKISASRLNASADRISVQYRQLIALSDQLVISRSVQQEIRSSINAVSQQLEREARRMRGYASSLRTISDEYIKAENNVLADIKGSELTTIGNGKGSSKEREEARESYKQEVQRILDRLRGEDIGTLEQLKYLWELLQKASFDDPENCSLSKAEKEALLRFIAPAMEWLGEESKSVVLTGESITGSDIVTKLINSFGWNVAEAGLVYLIREPLGKLLGFTYNSATDSYYTKEGCNQQNWGFCDGIDDWGPALGMDLDTDVRTFMYDGQEFRVQLWKGAYGWGGAVGSELAVYSRSAEEAIEQPYVWGSEDSKYILYESTGEEYQPKIKQTTIYTDANGRKKSFACDTRDYGDGDDYWNLNIRTEAGTDTGHVQVCYEVDCSEQGEGYAQALYESFRNDPELKEPPEINGTTIIIRY